MQVYILIRESLLPWTPGRQAVSTSCLPSYMHRILLLFGRQATSAILVTHFLPYLLPQGNVTEEVCLRDSNAISMCYRGFILSVPASQSMLRYRTHYSIMPSPPSLPLRHLGRGYLIFARHVMP